MIYKKNDEINKNLRIDFTYMKKILEINCFITHYNL